MLQKTEDLPGFSHENITAGDPLEKLRCLRVYVETYGCRYNFGDTAKLIEVLKHQGCFLVYLPEEADAVIINTCTVVAPTERRMLRTLSRFRGYNLFVIGCMPAVQREAIFAVCKPVIISSDAIHEAYRKIGTVPGGGLAIVQAAQACSGRCSYCLSRVARGPLKSFAKKEILAEIAAHIQAGTPEIQITAKDVSSWGLDKGTSLPESYSCK